MFQYDKINYLMLMMIDPNVHFHILPRYSENRDFEGFYFKDYGWPGLPDFSKNNEIDDVLFFELKNIIKDNFID